MIVAFGRQEPLAGHVEVAVKPPFGTFGRTAAAVDDRHGLARRRPASDAAGNVTLIWLETIAGTRAVRGTTRPVGGTFGPVQTISDTGTNAELPAAWTPPAAGRSWPGARAAGCARRRRRAGESVRRSTTRCRRTSASDDAPTRRRRARAGPRWSPGTPSKPGLATRRCTPRRAHEAGERVRRARRTSPSTRPFRGSQQLAAEPRRARHTRLDATGTTRRTATWSRPPHAGAPANSAASRPSARSSRAGAATSRSTSAGEGTCDAAVDTTARPRYATRPEGGGFGAPQAMRGLHQRRLRARAARRRPTGPRAPSGAGTVSAACDVETARIRRRRHERQRRDSSPPPTAQSGTSSYFDGRYGVAARRPRQRGGRLVRTVADVAPGPATDLRQRDRGADPRRRARRACARVSVPPAAMTGVPRADDRRGRRRADPGHRSAGSWASSCPPRARRSPRRSTYRATGWSTSRPWTPPATSRRPPARSA